MKYRGSTEIIDSILRTVQGGSPKTHIMYNAYLSYSQLKEYLSLLQLRDLIVYEQETHLYRLTEKGLRFINAYEKINELIPSADERK
jgi:predicted transcriptional regulator